MVIVPKPADPRSSSLLAGFRPIIRHANDFLLVFAEDDAFPLVLHPNGRRQYVNPFHSFLLANGGLRFGQLFHGALPLKVVVAGISLGGRPCRQSQNYSIFYSKPLILIYYTQQFFTGHELADDFADELPFPALSRSRRLPRIQRTYRYRRPVVSLAVLGDEEANWRPNHFGYSFFGCSMGLQFPIVKLLDYAAKAEELEADPNPFAAVVLVHLKTRETRTDPVGRLAWKFRLIRILYDRGLDGEQVRLLFKCLDWMMVLPPELEEALSVQMAEFEKERRMPYVSSIERIAMEKGKAVGIAEGKAEANANTLLILIAKKCGTAVPPELNDRIRSTTDPARLEEWINEGLDIGNLADFRRLVGI